MDRFAVLQQGFERLSYPLGKCEPEDKLVFSEGREKFVLHRLQSETQAEMAVGASGFLEAHASAPVGYVGSEKGEFYLVCKKGAASASKEIAVSVVKRLAALHTLGFGCGGLDPDAVEFSQGQAVLSDPSRIFALTESDSLFYEAVATLRSLVSRKHAKKSDLPGLARAYVSHSPVCRHGVRQHMEKKGMKGSPAAALADSAKRFAGYF